MVFLSLFNKSFHKVLSKFPQKVDVIDFDKSLNNAILYWYDELSISYEYRAEIEKFKKKLQEFIDSISRKWVFTIATNSLQEFLKKYIINNLPEHVIEQLPKNKNGVNMKNQFAQYFVNVAFIIFLAFVIIAVFYVTYKFFNSDTSETPIPLLNQRPLDSLNNVLLLVINAGRENLIEDLQMNGQVTNGNFQELYTATDALWVGDESSFVNEFQPWFDKNRKVAEEEKSTLDVYLVKISLKNDAHGFKYTADDAERFIAFRELPENSQKVLVSPRLPVEAYANEKLYSKIRF